MTSSKSVLKKVKPRKHTDNQSHWNFRKKKRSPNPVANVTAAIEKNTCVTCINLAFASRVSSGYHAQHPLRPSRPGKKAYKMDPLLCLCRRCRFLVLARRRRHQAILPPNLLVKSSTSGLLFAPESEGGAGWPHFVP